MDENKELSRSASVVARTMYEAMKLIKKQGYKNVSGKMYKGMRHEILNERENTRVYKEILEFIG